MSIALLLQFMGGGLGGGGGGSYFILSVGGETEGGYHLIVFVFFSCFCILLSHILSAFI